MEYRALGKTGIQVSVVGVGGLFVSRVGGKPREEAHRAVRRALELGVNYVDTAPGYADSEEVLGEALEGVTQPFILSTKLGGRPQPFDPKNSEQLRQSVEESLRLLRRDHIDILMIHEPDRPGQYDWWNDESGFHGPVNDVLDSLKEQGITRFTGLGGTTAYTLPHVIATGRYDVVLTAFNYSLLWREALIAVIPEARRRGMGIIVGSPLQQGALARRYDDEVRSGAWWLSPPRREQYQALYAFLDEIGLPIAEVAMRMVLSNPDISTMLSGVRSVEEVETNLAAVAKGPLPADVLTRLGEIAAMVPFRPFEEPFGLPFDRHYRGPGIAR
ncbi:aldo/keto reductase [Candidatus Poribacteria bacterium]|nr:aldo/keto reductase [Candidatus Poribacteria bacterium]